MRSFFFIYGSLYCALFVTLTIDYCLLTKWRFIAAGVWQ